MKSVLLPAMLLSLGALLAPSVFSPAQGHSWFSNYSTGHYGKGGEFEACCGGTDCRTAEELGYPKMRRDKEGGYNVKIGKYWIHYDFPAVHPSEDSKTWICYMDTGVDPEPLCLFLPPGII